MANEKKNIPENTEAMLLTDDQLENVTGGEDLSLSAVPIIYLRCAVDARHIWPNGAKVCPICGSKEYIRTGVRG